MELTIQCAWCGLVRRGDLWVTEFVPPDADNVTHGICPSCDAEMRKVEKSEKSLSERTPLPRLG